MPALRNIGLLATCAAEGGQGEIHAVPEAALAWDDDGRVTWAGPQAKMPRRLAAWKSEDDLDAGGRLVVPGLVDCHTHLAFGGWRADEFVRRARGESYADIARAGGGILSTVRATREASEDELVERAAGFLERMLALGITTVEAKSGYGLDLHQEIKLLRVYRRLAERVPQALVPTLLAAHAVPPEYAGDRE
nr:amidohydrolase family protein [Candidatus Palauibacterales bacterium]